MGQLMYPVNAARCQRTGQHNNARARHSQRGDPDLGGPGEGAGDYADRRDSSGLGYYCVVETPRRAGASIGNAVDHSVTLVHQ